MQLTLHTKAPKHHVFCPVYGKGPARGCYQCEVIREQEAARRARGPMPADDLLGER